MVQMARSSKRGLFLQATLFVPFILALLLALSFPSSAQISKPIRRADLGSLTLGHDHMRWPAPESLIRDLRADDDQTRLKAFLQLGLPKQQKTAIAAVPYEVGLRYATLGTDDDEQAIVAVDIGAMLYGAVAAQEGGSWHRIANFSCWCKYESGDLLGEFIQIKPGPDGRSELVLRASGGGTGVYSQNEAHFRYYRGELHLVFSFVSHYQDCPITPGPYTCRVERRWFYGHSWDSTPGGVLVESHLSFLPYSEPEVEFAIRDLELGHAKTFSCKTYKWNKEKFLYEQFAAPNPCKPSPPNR